MSMPEPGQQPVPEHHPPVGDHEMRCPPVQERPHRQPADDQQPDGQMTSSTTFLAVLPVQLVDERGDERGQRRADHQHQHRADEPLPVRMAVQHHLFVGGQHVLRVAHGQKLYGSTGRKCAMSPADTVTTSRRCRCAACPVVDVGGDALDRAVPGQAGPHPGPDRQAARPVIVGQRGVGALGVPPAADAGRQMPQHRIGDVGPVDGRAEHRQRRGGGIRRLAS